MEKKSDLSPAVLFGAAVVFILGTWLRFHGLGTESLWHDESWSWMLIRDDVTHLFNILNAMDAHPPLYYLLLKITVFFSGTSEAGLRTLSAAAGALSLLLLFRVGRRLGGNATGLVAMILLAASPFHVAFSQEARCYSLLFLLCLISLDLLTGLREKSGRLRWIALGACTAAIMYTHYLGAFFILGEIAWCLVSVKQDFPFFRRLLFSLGGAFLLFLPWLPTSIRHTLLIEGDFWIPAPTLEWILASLRELSAHSYNLNAAWSAAICLPIFLVAGLGTVTGNRSGMRPLAFLFLLPLVLELLISLHRPIWYTRTFMYVLIPFFLLAAIPVARLRPPLREFTLFALLCTFVPGLLHVHLNEEKENWRDLSIFLQSRAAPDEKILVQPWYLPANIEYYDGRAGPNPPLLVRHATPGETPAGTPEDDPRPFHEAAFSPEVQGLWLVARYGNRGSWPDILDRDFEKKGTFFFRKVEVDWYQRRPRNP